MSKNIQENETQEKGFDYEAGNVEKLSNYEEGDPKEDLEDFLEVKFGRGRDTVTEWRPLEGQDVKVTADNQYDA